MARCGRDERYATDRNRRKKRATKLVLAFDFVMVGAVAHSWDNKDMFM